MRYLSILLLLFIAGHAHGQDAPHMSLFIPGRAQDPDTPHLYPSHPWTLGNVTIQGNTVTRSSVILREIDLHKGATIRPDSIEYLRKEMVRRLYNMQLFNEVSVTAGIGRDTANFVIVVTERWFIIPTMSVQFADRNFNTWFVKQHHDLRRIMAGLTITDKNFRGDLEQLAVTVQAGYTQRLGINYLRPYANRGQTQGFGFMLSLAQSQQAYYTTDSNRFAYAGIYSGPVIQRQFEGGINYIYRPAYASRHFLQLGYKDYYVGDTILQLNPGYFQNGSNRARFLELLYRYEYNGVDNWNYSLQGYKLVGYGVARQGFTGIGFQAYAQVEAGAFRRSGRAWYTAAVFRGRLMAPVAQPYYFRGGLGTQTDYVRGYEYYIIDGSHYGLLRLDLKRELVNRTKYFNIKYFNVVPLRVYPKIFVDLGYIDSPMPGNSFLSNRPLYSIGAGLDIITLYDVKIRLEYSWNHLGQNGLYLHFNSE